MRRALSRCSGLTLYRGLLSLRFRLVLPVRYLFSPGTQISKFPPSAAIAITVERVKGF